MNKYRRDLVKLSRALRGDVVERDEWATILSMANEALITPELHVRRRDLTKPSNGEVPVDVECFLAEVWRRNQQRNERLFSTLCDAVSALNKAGIQPVLLKGCSMWGYQKRDFPANLGRRLMSDIDLLVRPTEMEHAAAALQRSEFKIQNDHREVMNNSVLELGRPSDVGQIDLHQRPPGPRGIAEIDALHDHCDSVLLDGTSAKLPRIHLQILILVLHDQFHDQKFWHGGFDLRHLIDMAILAPNLTTSDWQRLEELCPNFIVRHALFAQLTAAHKIAGAAVPAHVRSMLWGNFHVWRQGVQADWPIITDALLPLVKSNARLKQLLHSCFMRHRPTD